jgi:hypothetical protein
MVIEKKYHWHLCNPQGHCQAGIEQSQAKYYQINEAFSVLHLNMSFLIQSVLWDFVAF